MTSTNDLTPEQNALIAQIEGRRVVAPILGLIDSGNGEALRDYILTLNELELRTLVAHLLGELMDRGWPSMHLEVQV